MMTAANLNADTFLHSDLRHFSSNAFFKNLFEFLSAVRPSSCKEEKQALPPLIFSEGVFLCTIMNAKVIRDSRLWKLHGRYAHL